MLAVCTVGMTLGTRFIQVFTVVSKEYLIHITLIGASPVVRSNVTI